MNVDFEKAYQLLRLHAESIKHPHLKWLTDAVMDKLKAMKPEPTPAPAPSTSRVAEFKEEINKLPHPPEVKRI